MVSAESSQHDMQTYCYEMSKDYRHAALFISHALLQQFDVKGSIEGSMGQARATPYDGHYISVLYALLSVDERAHVKKTNNKSINR